MPANDSVEFDYIPGYTKPTHEYGAPFGDEFHAEAVEELLLSMVGYTQRGVTLAGGQGILPTGCVIARHTASGRYFAYQAAGTDGRGAALGVLRDARDTGGGGAASLAAYNANTNSVNPDAITLAGGAVVFPASPAGKVAGDCLGNMVIRGILNANVVSGTETTNVINGAGVGSGAGQILSQLGARYVAFGSGLSGQGPIPFPGGPMDGNPTGGAAGVNAFVF
jgi:Bacteriophage lambda head decoration protein D